MLNKIGVIMKDYILQYKVHKTNVIFSSMPYSDLKSAARAYERVALRMIRDDLWIYERNDGSSRRIENSELDNSLEEIRGRKLSR